MAKPIAQRIRLLLDSEAWNRPAMIDQLTNLAPVIASGADLQFEMFICTDNPGLFDYTNCASITLELSAKSNPLINNVLFSQQVVVASINTACTLANFNAGTDQAITLLVPNANTQLAVTAPSASYTLAIYATSNDATPKLQPILVMDLNAVDAGLPLENPALPQIFKVGSSVPFVCSDGKTRNVTMQLTPNGKWTIAIGASYNGPGQQTYSLYCSDGLFRDLTVIQADGYWTVDINQAGHS